MALLAAAIAALLGATATSAQAQVFGINPKVNSMQATDVTTTSATLTAAVTYNEKDGNFSFSYCRVSDCENSRVDTPRQEEHLENDTEAITQRTVAWPIDGLTPGTEYKVFVHAGNDSHYFDPTEGWFTFTTVRTNVTVTVPPTAVTRDPSDIQASSATLHGTAIAGTTGGTSVGSRAYFEWGDGALDQATTAEALPADANPRELAAPIAGLASSHDYRYRLVIIRGGQRFEGAVRTLHTAWAPDCAAGTTYQTARLERVVATGCFMRDGGRWVADGDVRINGVLLQKDGDRHDDNHYRFGAGSSDLQDFLDGANRLYIDRDRGALGTTGDWKASTQNLVGFYSGVLDFDGLMWGGHEPLLSLGADDSVDLFSFPLAGQLSFTPSSDGSSRLGVLVSLPLPKIDSLTGEAAVKVNPGGDLALDRLRVEVGMLPVKGFELGNLKLDYDRRFSRWIGSAEVTIPTTSAMRVRATVVVTNGAFSSFEGSVDGLNQHLAYGVYLQRVGVRVGVDPIHLGGTIGLSAGPKVSDVGILGIDGDFDLYGPGRRDRADDGDGEPVVYPAALSVGGTATVFDIPLLQASVTWYFSRTPWIEGHAELGINVTAGDYTVFSATGTVDAELYGSEFSIEGRANVTAFNTHLAGAKVIAGTRGIGACGYALGFEGGAYRAWDGDWEFWPCDMDELSPEDMGVSAASASGGERLRLPAATRALVLSAALGGAPRGRLQGPGGRTLDTPAAGELSKVARGEFLSVRDDKHKRTDVLLANPGNGWTYEVLPGSARVAGVKTAGELPDVGVHARVKRHGRRAVLRWKLDHLAGRRVTFMESGPGAPPRVIKRTKAASGHVRFKPFLTPERRRTIVAVVEQQGRIRSRVKVAHYTAPRAPRMTRVRSLKAVRKGKAVKASWHKVRGAAKYQVVVAERSGRRTLRTVKHPHLRVRAHVRKLTVRAVGYDAATGKPRTVKVKKVK
jgi:hypothetical protein